MTSLLTTIRSSVPALLLLFVLFAGGAYAGTFTEPAGSPPGSNLTPPVNLGSVSQTKAGGIWANTIGSTNGYLFGANAGWLATSSQGTIISQQYCIGTDPNNLANDSCTTSFGGGSPSGCQIQRDLVESIPRNNGSNNGYTWPVNDYCAVALTYSGGNAGLKASDGWVAVGQDGCAEYGGDGDNCNGIGKSAEYQCHYVRLVCNGTPATQVSNAIDYQ